MSSLSRVLVEKVDSISPHNGADTLELLHLSNGFTVVDKIGKFVVGERLVYIPVDMVAPEREEYEFLRQAKFRIKGKKIRGIVSCGLAVKLDNQETELNTDLTDELGFLTYETPEPSRPGASLGRGQEVKAPIQMGKYDIESIRKYHKIFNPEIVILEKIHGCWSGYLSYDGQFYCKSRGRWIAHDGNSVWSKTAEKYGLQEICEKIPDIMICGENYGWVADLRYGHQSGEVSFAAFDAFHTKWNKFLDYNTFVQICDQYNIPRVPEIYIGEWKGIDHIKLLAESNTKIGFDLTQISEGVVVKYVRETWNPSLGRVILKYPSNQFLTR